MGEYDISQWRLAGTEIHTPSDPKMATGVRTGFSTWDECRAISERKSRTHPYVNLVDLLIKLALERENESHMEKISNKQLGQGGTPTPKRGEGKGPKNPPNANQGGGKGRDNLRAMNEVKPDAGTPPLFYCTPVNDTHPKSRNLFFSLCKKFCNSVKDSLLHLIVIFFLGRKKQGAGFVGLPKVT